MAGRIKRPLSMEAQKNRASAGLGSYRENDHRPSQLCLMPLTHFRAGGAGLLEITLPSIPSWNRWETAAQRGHRHTKGHTAYQVVRSTFLSGLPTGLWAPPVAGGCLSQLCPLGSERCKGNVAGCFLRGLSPCPSLGKLD